VNPKTSAHLAKGRRILTAIPTADLLTVILIIVTVGTIGATLIGGNVTPQTMPYLWAAWKAAIGTGIVLIVLLILKTRVEYKRRKYDYTLAFILDEWFEKLELQRSEAAKVCKKYLDLKSQKGDMEKWGDIAVEEREKVEPVLDFFEDLGFYLHGDQISDEVAHHHYYHWLLGYYSILESYIEFYQKHDPNGEPSAYVWIEPLFNRLSEIEKTRPRPTLILKSYEAKVDFLKEEWESRNQ